MLSSDKSIYWPLSRVVGGGGRGLAATEVPLHKGSNAAESAWVEAQPAMGCIKWPEMACLSLLARRGEVGCCHVPSKLLYRPDLEDATSSMS